MSFELFYFVIIPAVVAVTLGASPFSKAQQETLRKFRCLVLAVGGLVQAFGLYILLCG